MSREIKYRFWNKKIGAMIDWDLMKKECDRLSIFTHPDFIPLEFCGLVDKNGKEIFEGDVVKILNAPSGKKLAGEVKQLNGGAFYIHHQEAALKYKHQIHCEVCEASNYPFYIEYFEPYEIEAIGNIYENPELLKGSP